MVLLHGLLDVDIYEGRHIPASLTTKATGTLKKIICCGAGPALLGSNDPYLALDVGDTRRLRSSFCRSTHHPQWNERAEVFLADEAEEITIYVKDAAIIGSDYLGQAKLPVSSILDGREFDGWLQLTDQNGKPVGHSERLGGEFHQAAVKLTIRFTPIIPEDGPLGEVPRTYFPMRHGNKVTLYHDSVATPGPVHDIRLAKARSYEEHSCWDDMYEAILQAKRFIWIAGWSVWVKTRLQRKPDRKENSPTMGELLIQKAKQGVTVLLLVWDDRSNNLGLHPGLMSTHDNETYKFFRRTKVTCVVAGRTGGMEDTFLQNQFNRNLFTHHQKTVVMDAPMPGQPNTTHDEPPPSSSSSSSSDSSGHDAGGQPGQKPTRRVIAFIGGLDLTDGRYDRHDHPLFETCGPGGPHCEDFYQACVEGFDSNRSCVRQPWHDLHSKVEGQIAMDICLNFIERWVEQAGKRKLAKIRHLGAHHDLLLPKGFEKFASKKETVKSKVSDEHMHHKAHIIKEHHPELNVKNPHHAESWAVQLFRSIDSDSASGFPKMSAGGYEAGLNVGKGKVIDKSIHDAYVHLIRRSKRYLYLENQYFLGGAHMWDSDKDTPAYNQIPVEIALKIASKIKAGEPFRAYIVIPMYPEGVPTSGSSQAILYYQSQTRRMMYRIVAQAIKEAGIEAHPTDYLQFFCLVKREGPETSQNLTDPQQDSPHASAPAGDKQHSSSTGARISSIRAHLPHLGGTDGGGLHGAKGDRSGMPYGQQKGKHRDKHSGNSVGPATLPPADPDTAQHRCTEACRFMIYVHSKMIVVDDEYVLLGSANINQRSLDGARDSEICIGAYQEGYTMNKPGDDLPRGQVSGFRRALWKEHIQELGPEHDDPSSLECMQSLRNIGNENWLAFKGEEVKWLPRGHLINYPIAVQVDGDVRPLGDCEEFPDLGGKIVGTKSAVLPGILTT